MCYALHFQPSGDIRFEIFVAENALKQFILNLLQKSTAKYLFCRAIVENITLWFTVQVLHDYFTWYSFAVGRISCYSLLETKDPGYTRHLLFYILNCLPDIICFLRTWEFQTYTTNQNNKSFMTIYCLNFITVCRHSVSI